MHINLDFNTAIEILKNAPFGSVDKFEGAVMFVAEAFNISIDTILEIIEIR